MTTLQEQHFKWETKINSIALEDRRLTFRALAAGDTLLTLIARATGSAKGELSTEHFEVASQIAGEVDKLAARLPVFFRRQLSFPYRDGSNGSTPACRLSDGQPVRQLHRARATMKRARDQEF